MIAYLKQQLEGFHRLGVNFSGRAQTLRSVVDVVHLKSSLILSYCYGSLEHPTFESIGERNREPPT